MPFRFVGRHVSAMRQYLVWLVLLSIAQALPGWADESVSKEHAEPRVAKPATKLVGKLKRARDKQQQRGGGDLLDQVNTLKDVAYTTDENPVPEDQQFQFVEGRLRTPQTGDARLVLPTDVPEFYHLAIEAHGTQDTGDPPIGIGAVYRGEQFLIKSQSDNLALDRFMGQQVDSSFHPVGPKPPSRDIHSAIEIFGGDVGILYARDGKYLELVGPPQLFSLDPKWAISAKDKLFLAFPDGQFDIWSIKLEALTSDEWLSRVKVLCPEGRLVWARGSVDKPKFQPDVDPLPDFEDLTPTFVSLARGGDFDELERWAERFRREQTRTPAEFASVLYYNVLCRAFIPTMFQSYPQMDPNWQLEFAFLEAWKKAKPDSVAARIVEGVARLNYARILTKDGMTPPRKGDKATAYQERVAKAEKILNEAAELETRDSCVFYVLLLVGAARDAERAEMDQALERGLAIAPQNFNLYDNMVPYLLRKFPLESGVVRKFAEQAAAQLKGDEALDAYGRIAIVCKQFDVFHDCDFYPREFGNTVGEKLLPTIPVLVERYAKDLFVMNYVCWLCCELGEPTAAQPLFAMVGDQPNLSIWGSRTKYDVWRHEADPSVPDPSEFLASEGEEIARMQGYSGGTVSLCFLPDSNLLATGSTQRGSAYKFWDFKQRALAKTFLLYHDNLGVRSLRFLPDGKLAIFAEDDRRWYDGKLEPPDYDGSVEMLYIRDPGTVLLSDDLRTTAHLEKGRVRLDRAKGRDFVMVPEYTAAALSGDANLLLTVDDRIHLWDTHKNKELAVVEAKPKLLAFTRDGLGIIYVTADKVAVWDIAKQQERFSNSFQEPNLVRVAVCSDDGRYLATGERRVDPDGTKHQVVVLWDLDSSKQVHVFSEHKRSVMGLAFSPDGKWLASSSIDGVVKVWDLTKAVAEAPAKP
jgi:WD domain, G-beta repeat